MQIEDLMLEQILGLCETATALVRSVVTDGPVVRDRDRRDLPALAFLDNEAAARTAWGFVSPV